MSIKNKQKAVTTVYAVLCAIILIAAPVMVCLNTKNEKELNEFDVLTIWQVDSFEGGKGSRASYLSSVGKKFADTENCYVNVISLSADAVRANFAQNNFPDLLSYGAGMYGIEKYLYGEKPFTTWAHGSYCLLTLDGNSNFDDVAEHNTVINTGNDNLTDVAAILCGVGGAQRSKPTGAYVQLINGKYKYLLGTQRDVYRLKTRGVAFKIKPITEFNDLYQNISVITKQPNKVFAAEKYISCLTENDEGLKSLGLMGKKPMYEDEMRELEGREYSYKLVSPISSGAKEQLMSAIANSDINLLKNLLK